MKEGILIKELFGQSGCRVLLMGNQRYFVRKIAGDVSYNPRLEAQKQKQVEFLARGLSCPDIIDDGAIDGLYFFDMEYIHGFDIEAVLGNVDGADSGRLLEALLGTLEYLSGTAEGTVELELFRKKIDSIMAADLPFGEDYSWLIDRIGTSLLQCDWKGVQASMCHGDMTLENLIQDRQGNVFYIDLLDSEISSFWLDIAKIHQDLSSFWFLRHIHDDPRHRHRCFNLQIAARRFADVLTVELERRWPEVIEVLPTLLAFQLFRIVPYCRERATLDFVTRKILELDIVR